MSDLTCTVSHVPGNAGTPAPTTSMPGGAVQWKYVIAYAPDGHEHAVVFDPVFQHSEMVPCCCQAVSAGFIMLYDGHLVVPDIPSESLHLGPRPEDKRVLKALLTLK